MFPDMREESAKFLVNLGFSGYAIGGLSVGESKKEMELMTRHTTAFLPEDKPRYLMGVGSPPIWCARLILALICLIAFSLHEMPGMVICLHTMVW